MRALDLACLILAVAVVLGVYGAVGEIRGFREMDGLTFPGQAILP